MLSLRCPMCPICIVFVSCPALAHLVLLLYKDIKCPMCAHAVRAKVSSDTTPALKVRRWLPRSSHLQVPGCSRDHPSPSHTPLRGTPSSLAYSLAMSGCQLILKDRGQQSMNLPRQTEQHCMDPVAWVTLQGCFLPLNEGRPKAAFEE